MSETRHNRTRGFSLIELSVVLGIVFIVAAFVIPNMLTNIELYRLRVKATALSSMLDRARSIAAKTNTPAGVGLTGSTFSILSNTADANQLQIVLPGNMSVPTTGMPDSLTAAVMGIPSAVTVTVAGSDNPVYFSARGLPCPYDSATNTCSSANTNQAYVYYLRDTAHLGDNGWAAVSVSPSGRIKAWRWSGSEWK